MILPPNACQAFGSSYKYLQPTVRKSITGGRTSSIGYDMMSLCYTIRSEHRYPYPFPGEGIVYQPLVTHFLVVEAHSQTPTSSQTQAGAGEISCTTSSSPRLCVWRRQAHTSFPWLTKRFAFCEVELQQSATIKEAAMVADPLKTDVQIEMIDCCPPAMHEASPKATQPGSHHERSVSVAMVRGWCGLRHASAYSTATFGETSH